MSALPRGLVITSVPALPASSYRDANGRSTLVVSRPWRAMWGTAPAIFRLVAGLAMTAMLAPVIACAPPIASLMLLVGCGFGLVSAYAGLAVLMNDTKLVVRGNTFRVTHGPLPWIGGGATRIGTRPTVGCVHTDRHRVDRGNRDLRGGARLDPRIDIVIDFPDAAPLVAFRQLNEQDAWSTTGALREALGSVQR